MVSVSLLLDLEVGKVACAARSVIASLQFLTEGGVCGLQVFFFLIKSIIEGNKNLYKLESVERKGKK